MVYGDGVALSLWTERFPWVTGPPKGNFPLKGHTGFSASWCWLFVLPLLSLASEELGVGQGMLRKEESRSQKVGITGLCNVNID